MQRLWALDRNTFTEVINTSGSELKRLFDKHSAVKESNEPVPQRYMTLVCRHNSGADVRARC